RSPASLLDSYNPERHQAGRDMLCLPDHLHRTALREDPHLSFSRASDDSWPFGAGPREGDRAVDARLMLHPGRESVRFFQRLRGTAHHLVLFAGARATGETHQRLQALADTTIHATPAPTKP